MNGLLFKVGPYAGEYLLNFSRGSSLIEDSIAHHFNMIAMKRFTHLSNSIWLAAIAFRLKQTFLKPALFQSSLG